jgi:hypothetical protein
MEEIKSVLIEGSDHELLEYHLQKTKVVKSNWCGRGETFTLWFEGYPLLKDDVIEERWVGF